MGASALAAFVSGYLLFMPAFFCALDLLTYKQVRFIGSSQYAMIPLGLAIHALIPLLMVLGVSCLLFRDFCALHSRCCRNTEAEARAWMDPDWE